MWTRKPRGSARFFAGAGRDRQSHRRARRNRGKRADLPFGRRACSARRRAGLGQDAAGPHAVAESLDLSFRRIQFTPDLMPADITGTDILIEERRRRREFDFSPGPFFAQHRAGRRNQPGHAENAVRPARSDAGASASPSAADIRCRSRSSCWRRRTHWRRKAPTRCRKPNSTASSSSCMVPSPTLAELAVIVDRTTGAETPTVGKVLNEGDILELRDIARRVPIAPHVRDYAAALVVATHPDSAVRARYYAAVRARRGKSARGAGACFGGQNQRPFWTAGTTFRSPILPASPFPRCATGFC